MVAFCLLPFCPSKSEMMRRTVRSMARNVIVSVFKKNQLKDDILNVEEKPVALIRVNVLDKYTAR